MALKFAVFCQAEVGYLNAAEAGAGLERCPARFPFPDFCCCWWFRAGGVFLSALCWEPFHPLLLINSPRSSRMREMSLGRKELQDYSQPKTCRDSSSWRVSSDIPDIPAESWEKQTPKNSSTPCKDVTNPQGFSFLHSCQKTPEDRFPFAPGWFPRGGGAI